MRTISTQLIRMAALILLSGFACACLVHYAPGALVDERELNQHAGEDTLAALRAHKEEQNRIGPNFLRYLKGLTHGDLGYSESNNSPVAALLADRAPQTLRDLVFGLAGAWILGFGFAIPAACFPKAWRLNTLLTVIAGLLLSLPAALIAYLFVVAGSTSMIGAVSRIVLALVIAPKLFQYARNILLSAYGGSHVDVARARGIGTANSVDACAPFGRAAVGSFGRRLRQHCDRRGDPHRGNLRCARIGPSCLASSHGARPAAVD